MSSNIAVENKRSVFGIIIFIINTLFWAFLWVFIIILIVLRIFVFQQVNVVGHSMDPNYAEGQMLVINKIEKVLERGQVVAVYANKDRALNANYFTPYDSTNTFFLKRVIGLPGESIEMYKSNVIIYNDQYPEGAILKEKYLSKEVISELETNTSFTYFPKIKVEFDSYYLMGDNRPHSLDSRNRGTFPSYTVFGQEVLRYWPFEQGKMFYLPNYTFEPLNETLKAEIELARQK